MKREMSSVVKLAATALLVSNVSIAHASYSNVEVGSYYAPNRITPGMTTNLSASVCAQRNSNVTIPVSFYFSPTPYISGASTSLGSVSASLSAQGSFCSSIVNKTVTLPTQTLSTCFNPFNGYFIFKAGSDVKATPYGVIGSDVMPTVESFSPASGHPGSVVHIKGQNFNADSTAVFIGDVEAARGFEKDANDNIIGMFAIVPEGATSNKINVKQISNGYPLCGGSESLSTYDFVVTAPPVYCASSALYNGYSKIDYVGSKNITTDFRSDSACGGYADHSDAITYTSQGTASEQVNVQFGTCGAPDYSKLFKVYVDWNNDNDFDDPGEFVVSAPSVAADTLYSMG
ncbi:MAG: IPT/TIG domain-containing protein, partial [Algicola sp.]|nr:IPT/TIG domain-containing protein [Algicola sp.]